MYRAPTGNGPTCHWALPALYSLRGRGCPPLASFQPLAMARYKSMLEKKQTITWLMLNKSPNALLGGLRLVPVPMLGSWPWNPTPPPPGSWFGDCSLGPYATSAGLCLPGFRFWGLRHLYLALHARIRSRAVLCSWFSMQGHGPWDSP